VRRSVVGVFLLLVLVASVAQAQKRGDRSLITRADLNEGGGGVTTAHDAVQRLRPNWLRPAMGRIASSSMTGSSTERGTAATEPIIYIDEVRQPNLEALRTVAASKVVQMKYLDQNRAVQLLGPGHEAGAIQVTTVDKR